MNYIGDLLKKSPWQVIGVVAAFAGGLSTFLATLQNSIDVSSSWLKVFLVAIPLLTALFQTHFTAEHSYSEEETEHLENEAKRAGYKTAQAEVAESRKQAAVKAAETRSLRAAPVKVERADKVAKPVKRSRR